VGLRLSRAERHPEGAADPGSALRAPGVGHSPDGCRAVFAIVVAAGLQHYDELPDGAQTHVAHLGAAAVVIRSCPPGLCFSHSFCSSGSSSFSASCSMTALHDLVIMHALMSSRARS